jgi:hypothetical protein
MTEGEQERLEEEMYVQECADAIEDVEGVQTEQTNSFDVSLCWNLGVHSRFRSRDQIMNMS